MATTLPNKLASRQTAEMSQVKGLQEGFCSPTCDHCYHHAASPDTLDKIHLYLVLQVYPESRLYLIPR